MKAAVLVEKEKIEYMEVPVPKLGPTELLIKVSYVGICGSDIKSFHGENPYVQMPRILGHEFSGVVVDNGSGINWSYNSPKVVVVEPLVTDFSCYYCRKKEYNRCKNLGILGVHKDGAFAEYVAVDYRWVHPMDFFKEAVGIGQESLEKFGTLIEPAAIGYHVLGRMDLSANDNVYIIGSGLIGIMIAKAVHEKARGNDFLITDVDDSRLATAARFFGDYHTFNSGHVTNIEDILRGKKLKPETVDRLNETGGFDVVVEAVGLNQTYNLALKLAKKGGRVMHVGIIGDGKGIDLSPVMRNELTIVGCRVYDGYKDFNDAIFSFCGENEITETLENIISDVAPLSEAQGVFESGVKGLKVLLDPSK